MTPRTVQEIMGHSNYNTTVSYTHVLDDIKLKAAVNIVLNANVFQNAQKVGIMQN